MRFAKTIPWAQCGALLSLLSTATLANALDDSHWMVGGYSPYGRITIDATPNEGSWTLTGPPGFTTVTGVGDRVGSATIAFIMPGDYTLTCDDNIASHSPPAIATRTLLPKGAIDFTPTWLHDGGATIIVYLPDGTPMELVRIPSGSFQMGSNDPGWSFPEELPVHPVDIGYDFYMGKYEVTQRQWLAVMGDWPTSAPSADRGLGDDFPAYYVSWDDIASTAAGFIATLNAHLSATSQPADLRLPSESESEYACRAGTTTRYYFGDSDCTTDECDSCQLNDYAWWCGNNSPNGAKPVGEKLPNAFGLYDMLGNVWEWRQDTGHERYTDAPADGSAWEDAGATDRILRGGYFNNRARYCRSASRLSYSGSSRTATIGFRVCRSEAAP